jgi:hypothetical protein
LYTRSTYRNRTYLPLTQSTESFNKKRILLKDPEAFQV